MGKSSSAQDSITSSKAGGPLPPSTKLPCADAQVKTFDATARACSYAGYGTKGLWVGLKLGALRSELMIAHSGTACVTGSIEWGGVLVGALGWCSEPTLKWGVNPMLAVLSQVI